jgi:hypothetical protein
MPERTALLPFRKALARVQKGLQKNGGPKCDRIKSRSPKGRLRLLCPQASREETKLSPSMVRRDGLRPATKRAWGCPRRQ